MEAVVGKSTDSGRRLTFLRRRPRGAVVSLGIAKRASLAHAHSTQQLAPLRAPAARVCRDEAAKGAVVPPAASIGWGRAAEEPPTDESAGDGRQGLVLAWPMAHSSPEWGLRKQHEQVGRNGGSMRREQVAARGNGSIVRAQVS
eukprot:scaffold193993_cov35-Tisochrysis_lutea.AAC.3